MDVQEILETYGEYGLTYDVAKENGLLAIQWHEDFEEAKEYIKEYITTKSNKSEEYMINLEEVCVMEVGCLDIEFTSYGLTEEGNLDIGFYSCVYYTNGDWESHGFTDLAFDMSLLESKDKLERAMFNSLMRYAKKNELAWSEPNHATICEILHSDMYFSNIESLKQMNIQIKQRANNLGLGLGEYLKRLAIADIRKLDDLEVEPEYRIN